MVKLVTVFGKLWKWYSISDTVNIFDLIVSIIYLKKNNIGLVILLLHHKVDHYVSVTLYKHNHVVRVSIVQSMVIGVLGQVIPLVVLLAVQVFKLEFVFIDLLNLSVVKLHLDSIL